MPWIAIVQRQRTGCGRNGDKTYVNVVGSVREILTPAATFIAGNPSHPWADPLFREFIVDITEQQANAPRFHDTKGNLPLWQQETDGSASTFSPGSFADPEDALSVFTAGTSLADDRWIVRLYDNDPGTTGVHLASLDLDEGQDTGETTIYMKLFNSDGSESTTNTQNMRIEIAGRLMAFDFTAGVTTFGVRTVTPGRAIFPSSGRYKVVGPGDERRVTFHIYGRTIGA